MSHTVKVKTAMTDADLVKKAAEDQGISYRQEGRVIHFDSGPLRSGRLDLDTGDMFGDTDFLSGSNASTSTTLNRVLAQSYATIKLLADIESKGGRVINRRVDGDDVVIDYQAFG